MEIRHEDGLAELDQALHKTRKSKRKHRAKRIFFVTLICLVVLAGVGLGVKLIFLRQPADANPFTPAVQASLKFPVYYPTQLPKDYRIDTSSVTEPQAGVVVFNLLGPAKQKLYISEEARPSKFSIGNFYAQLTDLKEIPVSDGAIAVGRLHGGKTEIASRANNTTWILSNTNAQIPFDQLIAMLRNLKLSY